LIADHERIDRFVEASKLTASFSKLFEAITQRDENKSLQEQRSRTHAPEAFCLSRPNL